MVVRDDFLPYFHSSPVRLVQTIEDKTRKRYSRSIMIDPLVVQSRVQDNPRLLTRIAIVDDQKVVRAKIKEVLSQHQNIEVVGMAGDGEEAIAAIETWKPDLVLMDLEMPKMNGIKAIEIAARRFPELKILVLSTYEREEYIQKAIKAGADGYVLKSTPALDLVAAIQSIHRGGFYLGPGLLQKAQSAFSQASSVVDPEQFLPRQNHPQDFYRVINQSTSLQKLSQDWESYEITSNKANTATGLASAKTEEFLPSIERWMTWGGLTVMIVIASILPLSSIIEYKTKVKASATIRPEGEARLVQAMTEGQIAQILKKSGDTVEKGQPIATIDRFRFQTRKTQLEKAIAQQRLQLARLNSQIATVDRQKIAEVERNNSEIQAAESELSGNLRSLSNSSIEANSQVAEAQAQLKAAEATFSASENKLTRYRSAAAEGALSKEQLAEAKLEARQQQQEIEAVKARLARALATVDPSNAEVEMAQQRIQQARKSGLASIAGLEREREALIQQRIEVSKQIEQDEAELFQVNKELRQTDLIATATGTISKLELRNPGQSVQIGQEIAQIIPENGKLEIKTVVSPQDIGKLELEQEVQMRVSACPYPDYGLLSGKVNRIARDISQTQNDNYGSSNSSQQATPAFYEVFVTPEALSFGRGEYNCTLQPGMESSAEIITRKETVLQFILRKARLISNI